MAVKKLLFIDTNIWLDFYRARTEAGLSLLRHLEQVSDKIIVTSQLEMEFKKNRQAAMMEGISELKPSQALSRPGFFSDAKEVRAIHSSQKMADSRIKKLKARYVKALTSPAENDPVYRICQRIFHKTDPLVITRDMPARRMIRRRALRRFLLGYPPRKKSDTSMGDAFNWEWMVECANSQDAELVIVSRDADYGTFFENKGYPNDHLVQEFRERVSRKRKLLLYAKLSEALRHFQIAVSEQEEREEEEIVQAPEPPALIDSSEAASSLERWQHVQQAVRGVLAKPEYQEQLRAIAEAQRAVVAMLNSPEYKERIRSMARGAHDTGRKGKLKEPGDGG